MKIKSTKTYPNSVRFTKADKVRILNLTNSLSGYVHEATMVRLAKDEAMINHTKSK